MELTKLIVVTLIVFCVECRRNGLAYNRLSKDVKDILSEEKSAIRTKLEQTSKKIGEEMETQINELRENISGVIQEVTNLRSILADEQQTALDNKLTSISKEVKLIDTAIRTALVHNAMPNTCPNGWFKIGRKCYIISQSKQSWYYAFQICQTVGGILAEPDYSDILAFSLMPYSNNRIWLGADDRDREGSWKWSTSNRTLSTLDSRWHRGEPNGSGDCLNLYEYSSVQLDDKTCGSEYHFACEMTLD